ncbi:MAG: hypothetical protein ACRERU_14585 [Methylococcales bacterium]
MTKEEAIQFKERWAAVNRFTIEEARRVTLEERMRSLNSLYLSALSFGWDEKLQAEEDSARERWRRLKERVRNDG